MPGSKRGLLKNLELLKAFDTSPFCLPIAQVEAGDAGEREFFLKVKPYIKRKDAFLVMNKLLPNRGGELDFVILSKRKIHLVEVKSWSGVLVQDPGDENKWIRFKHLMWEGEIRRYGQRLETRNELKVLEEKKEKLREYLCKVARLEIPEEVFRTWLVFMKDRNFALDEELYMNKNVITLNNLLYRVEREFKERITNRLARMILEGLVRLCLRDDEEELKEVRRILWEEIPKAERMAIQGALDRLPTWDYVVLKGGRELRGEILEFYVGGSSWDVGSLRKRFSLVKTRFVGGLRGKVKVLMGALAGKEDFGVPRLEFIPRDRGRVEYERAEGKMVMEAVADVYTELEEFVHLKLLKHRKGNNGIIDLPFYMMKEARLSPVTPSLKV